MRKEIDFKNKRLVYSDLGEGDVLVLLHGYLESKLVWSPISLLLSKTFRIIVPDLPGHGESETLDCEHSMANLADAVNSIVVEEKIPYYHLIGHSMGGYIAIEMAKRYTIKTKSLLLFHSTPYADSESKKRDRDREISLIESGKKELIVETAIPFAFSNENLNTFSKEIEEFKIIAKAFPEEGIIKNLKGMKSRSDNKDFFNSLKIRKKIIIGRNDNYLNKKVKEMIFNDFGNENISQLNKSGHMGMYEEPEKTIEIFKTLES